MEEKHHLEQPLLTTTLSSKAPNDAVYTFSNHDISIRLLLTFLIGALSLWANHEFSKGFEITILNADTSSSSGRRFEVFYVSNDEASRLVLEANDFVTKILRPTNATKINRVIVQLSSHDLHGLDYTIHVSSSSDNLEFVLNISPKVMLESDFKYKMRRVVQRGVAELWLHKCKANGAPREILDGMVEYVVVLAGLENHTFEGLKVVEKYEIGGNCWEGKDSKFVSEFLSYCEERERGFIGKFHEAMMRNEWHQRILDEALGISAKKLCGSFLSSYNL